MESGWRQSKAFSGIFQHLLLCKRKLLIDYNLEGDNLFYIVQFITHLVPDLVSTTNTEYVTQVFAKGAATKIPSESAGKNARGS